MVRLGLAACLVLAACSTPLLADAGYWEGSTDRLDDAWAEQALAHPERDRGWCQNCQQGWQGDHRVAHCEVREFSYPRTRGPIGINGGENSGMTVMGWDRDSVRVLYRV